MFHSKGAEVLTAASVSGTETSSERSLLVRGCALFLSAGGAISGAGELFPLVGIELPSFAGANRRGGSAIRSTKSNNDEKFVERLQESIARADADSASYSQWPR